MIDLQLRDGVLQRRRSRSELRRVCRCSSRRITWIAHRRLRGRRGRRGVGILDEVTGDVDDHVDRALLVEDADLAAGSDLDQRRVGGDQAGLGVVRRCQGQGLGLPVGHTVMKLFKVASKSSVTLIATAVTSAGIPEIPATVTSTVEFAPSGAADGTPTVWPAPRVSSARAPAGRRRTTPVRTPGWAQPWSWSSSTTREPALDVAHRCSPGPRPRRRGWRTMRRPRASGGIERDARANGRLVHRFAPPLSRRSTLRRVVRTDIALLPRRPVCQTSLKWVSWTLGRPLRPWAAGPNAGDQTSVGDVAMHAQFVRFGRRNAGRCDEFALEDAHADQTLISKPWLRASWARARDRVWAVHDRASVHGAQDVEHLLALFDAASDGLAALGPLGTKAPPATAVATSMFRIRDMATPRGFVCGGEPSATATRHGVSRRLTTSSSASRSRRPLLAHACLDDGQFGGRHSVEHLDGASHVVALAGPDRAAAPR